MDAILIFPTSGGHQTKTDGFASSILHAVDYKLVHWRCKSLCMWLRTKLQLSQIFLCIIECNTKLYILSKQIRFFHPILFYFQWLCLLCVVSPLFILFSTLHSSVCHMFAYSLCLMFHFSESIYNHTLFLMQKKVFEHIAFMCKKFLIYRKFLASYIIISILCSFLPLRITHKHSNKSKNENNFHWVWTKCIVFIRIPVRLRICEMYQ